jgi:Cu(I)/Ag(I) efflux system membrane fusion protein
VAPVTSAAPAPVTSAAPAPAAPSAAPVGSAPAPLVDPLAVPADAVIDTGTRQVVYREVSPGLYEAAVVRLGPRAEGDLYPVVAGLREGDRVVARGAFLVDAEARLSPGAGATYFGASGGPSKDAPGGAEEGR